jgi:hypothetical protein
VKVEGKNNEDEEFNNLFNLVRQHSNIDNEDDALPSEDQLMLLRM